MTYNEKVLKVIKKQKEIEMKRWEKGKKYHKWESRECAFCVEFEGPYDCTDKCPFLKSELHGCHILVVNLGYLKPEHILIEDMLSFLYQMEMYFKED